MTPFDKLRDAITRSLQNAEAGELELAIPPPCELGRRIPGTPFHPFPELYFPYSDNLSLRLPQGPPTPLSVNTLGLIAALQPHRDYVSDSVQRGLRCGTVRFRPNNTLFVECMHVSRSTMASEKVALQSSPLSAMATETANRLIQLRHTQLQERDSTERGLLIHLLALLVNLLDDAHVHAPKLPSHPKVRRAHQMAQLQAYDPKCSVQYLAKRVGMSPDHLSAVYRQEFGRPMSALLCELRLSRAKELLKYSTLNVSEVAYACGYRYPAYFTKTFREHVGLTPSDYRTSTLNPDEESTIGD